MIKIKPTNISNYFAPTGGGYKIADYSSIPKLPVNTNGPGAVTSSVPPSLTVVKKDNTLIYVLVGIGLVAGGIYFWHRYKEKEEEKNNSKNYRKT